MSFCVACGKVLSARMAALRKARGVKKRECTSCHKSDELNNRYCIFCGAEIQKRQLGAGNSEALEKFTMEISGVQDRSEVPERLRVVERPSGGSAVAASSAVVSAGMLPSMLVYVGLGLISALAVAYFSKVNFARTFYSLTSPVQDGLVLYTAEPNVNVILESGDKKLYWLGSTGNARSLAFANLEGGNYLARFSKEGFETVSQIIDVRKGTINLLGFDSPLELPRTFGEKSK
ncbi:MAG: hypothetical protein JSS86_03860 [Cyanobacteria bacterium SZAS LIN-2]|nr:hypothetical protein [Cyanobacteria bacterium SZAS LIN-2]